VETVNSGELWAPRKLLSQMCRGVVAAGDPRRLTTREEEILALLGKGYKNREIADALFISRETVRWHIRGIYSKLNLHDRQSLTQYSIVRKPPLAEGIFDTAREMQTRVAPSQRRS
jgi:DNA-binding NarL/FixJ family response regulator